MPWTFTHDDGAATRGDLGEVEADGRRQMEHRVALRDQGAKQLLVHHRPDRRGEARVIREMRDVLEATGRKVIENRHSVTLRQESLGQM